MTYDLVVRNGRAVLPGTGLSAADIAVSNGRIAAVTAPGEAGPAERELDAAGLVVLPGLVDPHVHFGLGHPDDWSTESRAAAQGGVTTVLNYIQSASPYTEAEPAERARAAATSVIDWATHPIMMSEEHLAELPTLVRDHDVHSFKYFANFKGNEGAYMGVEGTDTGFFFALCRAVAEFPDSLLAVHPENIETIWRLLPEVRESGADGLAAWNRARPDFVEAHDIFTALLFAHRTGCRIYIPHLTCREGLDLYRRHAADGWRAYVETCPHYLMHTYDSSIGLLGKVNPPLRSQDDIEALWAGLADGTINTVGSDHNSRPRAKKEGTIWTASAGFPGVDTLLPVMLSEGHHKRGLSLERVVELTATNPARIFGLHPKKGSIAPGADADLVLVDLDREETVTASRSESRSDFSIFEGQALRGWPVTTILRGTVIAQEGEVLAEAGSGRHVPRVPGTATNPVGRA
jgi:dihydropyrimidinase